MRRFVFAISIVVLASCSSVDEPPCKIEPEGEALACTMQYDPVCGCDGQTYGNECTAMVAGIQRTTPGECGEEKDPIR